MNDIAFLFCCDYFDKSQPDEDYADEYRCVTENGKSAYLFCLNTFLENGKLKIAPAVQPTMLIYRGWMLTYLQYTLLYNILQEKGYSMINSPEQYLQCHHLPSWYNLLKNNTVKSIWTNGKPIEQEVLSLLKNFNNIPLIVKDYVKLRKHEWHEACFIPNSSNTSQALQIINNFIDRQGEDLVGGIVLREYLPLNIIGNHEKSNMPIAKEIRVFCLYHEPFTTIKYWTGDCSDFKLNDDIIKKCQNLNSNFYTIDLAQTTDDTWVIMEIGDGQVSGLQEYDPAEFYNNLFQRIV